MTENEAKFLEKLDELANDTEVDMYSVANLNFFFEESANTIRKLFEEIQQYRAIGTVKRFRFLQEVCDLNCDELENIANSMIELKNYRLEIRANAIDEFAERLKEEYKPCKETDTEIYEKVCNRIDKIAEEMRGVN